MNFHSVKIPNQEIEYYENGRSLPCSFSQALPAPFPKCIIILISITEESIHLFLNFI